MLDTKERCPSCGKALSDKVVMLPESMVELLKLFEPQENYALCTKCGGSKLSNAHARIDMAKVTEGIQELQKFVPIVSIHSPLNWDYDIIGIVTAQSVMGTGMLSEFSASISDFFGESSPAFVGKIIQGEESGFSQLIKKTLAMGGNAVVAVDIDYSEIGTSRGMIMVCMTGTAIKLKNIGIFGKARSDAIASLVDKMSYVNKIQALRKEYNDFKWRI